MARLIASLLVQGGAILGRAFVEAWKQAGIKGMQSGLGKETGKLTMEEAKQILGVSGPPFKITEISKRYEHLFKQNDPSKSGSFYIQSKVVRAKEALDKYMKSPPKNKSNSK
eukprot:TRINITY_DN20748_c0_g1_i1.p1 TRINITY_DN20748_c0_g1~~TRINITY_DN20748_c0_g1_i1.p1  ORF type:complete len:112 (+),score=19.76 TRINITY_DN20748_c0_g1_i1:64-399(+)